MSLLRKTDLMNLAVANGMFNFILTTLHCLFPQESFTCYFSEASNVEDYSQAALCSHPILHRCADKDLSGIGCFPLLPSPSFFTAAELLCRQMGLLAFLQPLVMI